MIIDLQSYKDNLSQLDSTFTGTNRVLDNRSKKYFEQGIAFLKEVPSKRLIFNKLFGTNWEEEVSYLKLGAKAEWKLTTSTKVDALVNENKAIEYKKIKQFYNNGRIDEHQFKKLFNPFAAENYRNPITDTSIASEGVLGDCEKLCMLPDEYEKYVVLEYHHGIYDSEAILNALDAQVRTHYDVDMDSIIVDSCLHPYNPKCAIVVYKINGKKGTKNV